MVATTSFGYLFLLQTYAARPTTGRSFPRISAVDICLHEDVSGVRLGVGDLDRLIARELDGLPKSPYAINSY
jgi:hypothetical protein